MFLEIKDVTKLYDDAHKQVRALDGVSIDVQQGEYIALVGASGAGKSTLLALIGGLDHVTAGAISADGKKVSSLRGKDLFAFRNKRVGFVFQFYHLLHELNALENVALPALKSGMRFRDARAKAESILTDLGLSERIHFYPQEMSGGEQQRVAIARALMNDPELLLCDEPTGNLDPESTTKIRAIILALSREQKKTVILVTHNMDVASDADRIVKMANGKLIQ
jgi:putative ABC transport system ATP-binding protein